jgi:hypothetical protein
MTLRNNGIQSNELRNKMDNRASVALANDQLDELREKFVKVCKHFCCFSYAIKQNRIHFN